MKLQDFKTPLLFLIIGSALVILGVLLKITHWPYGNLIILVGGILEVIAAILVVIQLLKSR